LPAEARQRRDLNSQDAAQAPVAADLSPAAPDQVMAPIALYPDALVMQILAASVNSQEVLDAGDWLLENKSLQGVAPDEAAKKVGFGVPMTALLPFPGTRGPDVHEPRLDQAGWGRFQRRPGSVAAAATALRIREADTAAGTQRARRHTKVTLGYAKPANGAAITAGRSGVKATTVDTTNLETAATTAATTNQAIATAVTTARATATIPVTTSPATTGR
jgi:hypothetical protein